MEQDRRKVEEEEKAEGREHPGFVWQLRRARRAEGSM